MSSIRRSSLISVTLGLLTVIGAGFRSLSRREDSAYMVRAGPAGRLDLPSSAATGNGWCFRIYRVRSMPRFGFGSCDRRHKLLFEHPIIFWTRYLSKKLHAQSLTLRSDSRTLAATAAFRRQGGHNDEKRN